MNGIEAKIILQLRMMAKNISKDNKVLMSTAMLAINNAIADLKLQKIIEKSAIVQLKRRQLK